MSCIVVIYDGADVDEAAFVERVCQEEDPERGSMCTKLGNSVFRLQTINTQEMKIRRLRKEVQKGKLFWVRVEDDELRSSADKAGQSLVS